MEYTTPKVKLLSHTLNPELVVACAGKLCYSKVGVEELQEKQTEESITRFVTMLADMGHESPIEHASFTFAIEGVSRACTHQLVRHRIASYSQQSQRYVNLVETFDYIIPPAYRDGNHLERMYRNAMKQSSDAYESLVKTAIIEKAKSLGIAEIYAKEIINGGDSFRKEFPTLLDFFKSKQRKEYLAIEKKAIEDARYVLPNACETKIVVTMNARTLMNFFHHRACDRAQWEIRELTDIMIKAVREVAPVLFKKAGPNCVKGPCPEGTMSCGKVVEKRLIYTPVD